MDQGQQPPPLMGGKKKEEEEPMKEIKKRWEKFQKDDMEDKAGVLHGVKG